MGRKIERYCDENSIDTGDLLRTCRAEMIDADTDNTSIEYHEPCKSTDATTEKLVNFILYDNISAPPDNRGRIGRIKQDIEHEYRYSTDSEDSSSVSRWPVRVVVPKPPRNQQPAPPPQKT